MQYVEVQGERIPALGLGTWELTSQACRLVMERAIELGYRHFDTAQTYENEAKVGAAIGAAIRTSGISRDDFWVTTKLAPDHLREERVRKTARESLKRLGLEYIDLLLIHWPSREVPLSETLRAMEDLVDEGLTRYLGVSNFPPSMLEEALEIAPILCNQVEYHPYLAQDALLALCRRHDVMLCAYSPFAHGNLGEDDEVLREIAAAHGKTVHQIVLRWLIQQHNVATIPKASNEDHLRENIDIFDFELDHGEMRRIAELDRGERFMDPETAPDWETEVDRSQANDPIRRQQRGTRRAPRGGLRG